MNFRPAKEKDLSAIVQLMASDILGQKREQFQSPLPKGYLDAFKKIDADENQELIVVENENFEIIGTLQLTFIQYMSYRGGIRAQIENVFVREDQRGFGVGKQMFEWAILKSKEKGAHMLQLTSDKQRPRAIKFYENLGFKGTHEGMKMHF